MIGPEDFGPGSPRVLGGHTWPVKGYGLQGFEVFNPTPEEAVKRILRKMENRRM